MMKKYKEKMIGDLAPESRTVPPTPPIMSARSAVDHPNHYNIGKIEVIDAIEAWELNFSLGNAVKYIARADHKGKPIEDLQKARWYIDREIERRMNDEIDRR